MTTLKPSPFVLMSTQHGSMIINRNDYHKTADNRAYGVGYQLMNRSCYDPNDVQLILELLKLRHGAYGDGVVALDCGANIGVHTIEWANLMTSWGKVHVGKGSRLRSSREDFLCSSRKYYSKQLPQRQC